MDNASGNVSIKKKKLSNRKIKSNKRAQLYQTEKKIYDQFVEQCYDDQIEEAKEEMEIEQPQVQLIEIEDLCKPNDEYFMQFSYHKGKAVMYQCIGQPVLDIVDTEFDPDISIRQVKNPYEVDLLEKSIKVASAFFLDNKMVPEIVLEQYKMFCKDHDVRPLDTLLF